MGIDLGWNEAVKKFVTNVGLITTNGPWGHNIMAAEWTRQISYEPPLLSVHVSKRHATYDNIIKSREFGASITASDQDFVSSVAGNYKGKITDKIAMLKDLGVKLYRAKRIDVLMVRRAAANMECKVVRILDMGDHAMFVGRIVKVGWSKKEPILYHQGKYWKLGKRIEKPTQKFRDRVATLAEKHRRK